MTESSDEITESENGYTQDMAEIYKVSLEFTCEEPQPDSPPQKAPAPQPQGQVHWLTALGGSVLAVLGLYWLLRTRTP